MCTSPHPECADYSDQTEQLVACLIERPLDRSKPLWELYVMEGLASGDVAMLLKLHHAAVDGASSMQMYKELFDDRPVNPVTTPPAQDQAEAENERTLSASYRA
jgi:diacylglycerol O-acyltransferase